ncbi:hypothetical protein C8F04DRAFT_1186485 [Mycena alexandri]|uniref:Uncharacterized protein n=1 Tax=Mycena alexandri TaxID=1745969 RepID=A0AAD6SMU0_9AGAR|nr:hypothetical protein C8F04DRAFT_1186485 [Mycena alexandri]
MYRLLGRRGLLPLEAQWKDGCRKKEGFGVSLLIFIGMVRNNRNKGKGSSNNAGSSASHSLSFSLADLKTSAGDSAPIDSFVNCASADGSTFVHETIAVPAPSPLKRARLAASTAVPAAPTEPLNEQWRMVDRYDMENPDYADDPPVPELPRLPNPKRYQPSVTEDMLGRNDEQMASPSPGIST